MNFKKWLEQTQKVAELGEGKNDSPAHMLVVERCKSLRDMLDESLESILTEEEYEEFRLIESKAMLKCMIMAIREANNMFKTDSELDDSDKED